MVLAFSPLLLPALVVRAATGGVLASGSMNMVDSVLVLPGHTGAPPPVAMKLFFTRDIGAGYPPFASGPGESWRPRKSTGENILTGELAAGPLVIRFRAIM